MRAVLRRDASPIDNGPMGCSAAAGKRPTVDVSISGIIGAAWHHAHSHLWRDLAPSLAYVRIPHTGGGRIPGSQCIALPLARASPMRALTSQNDKAHPPACFGECPGAGAAIAGDLCDKSSGQPHRPHHIARDRTSAPRRGNHHAARLRLLMLITGLNLGCSATLPFDALRSMVPLLSCRDDINDCSGHGQCISGTCRCDLGWIGRDM